MEQVIQPIIPTGDDYDPDDYLGMEREDLIAYIEGIAYGETVSDITLPNGDKAVSAAITFTASPADF